MTPSELLSAAADRVRDLAAAATPGPWAEPYYDDNPGDEGWWVHNGREGMREHAVCVTFALNPRDEADTRWIAALSPAIAEPLEALFRAAADKAEWLTRRGKRVDAGWPPLALARVVVGLAGEDKP